MLTAYLVIAISLSVAAVLCFAYNTTEWADNRNSTYSNIKAYAKDCARNALFSLAAIVLIWVWPLTIPALFVYLVYVLYKEATASDTPTD